MFPRLNPRLVTPKDLVPLLVGPFKVLVRECESLLSIRLRKRWLLARDTSYESLSLKRCPDSFLAAVEAEEGWNFNLRGFAIRLRSCYPFN